MIFFSNYKISNNHKSNHNYYYGQQNSFPPNSDVEKKLETAGGKHADASSAGVIDNRTLIDRRKKTKEIVVCNFYSREMLSSRDADAADLLNSSV